MNPSIRTFKVMEGLANQNGGAHLRFRGQWLVEAGFHPGMSVQATIKEAGVMELRVISPAQLTGEDFQAAIFAFKKIGI